MVVGLSEIMILGALLVLNTLINIERVSINALLDIQDLNIPLE
jgi:hypothetical protein